MRYLSTRDPHISSGFHDALIHGLAPDGGLYIPETFPLFSPDTIQHTSADTLSKLGLRIMSSFITEVPIESLESILKKSLSFPIPLMHLDENIYLLEVFHGPTLAFKDVGARFMAGMLSYFLTRENKKINIIVATSGDTGSAIANAFHLMPNIDVYILYPSKKITFLQEQQMTTLGGNVHAIEVTGTFDDCQRLVKAALLDNDIRSQRLLTTANSINVGRLLPQIIYHAHGLCQLRKLQPDAEPTLIVPSGNFGNLTSAVYAQIMGFPIRHFVAATNINAVVPHYLTTGIFKPQPSIHSYSNAMDVGNPSNFERLNACYQNDYQRMAQDIDGVSISDAQTLQEIRDTYTKTGYILDPHTAVGVASARIWRNDFNTPLVVTATAHPAKFPEVIQQAIGIEPEIPDRLKAALNNKKKAVLIPPLLDVFKEMLI